MPNRKGNTHSPETRARMSAARKGRKHSPETRARMSASAKNLSPETRARITAGTRGRKLSPEAIARMSAANKGRKRSPEMRARMSAAKKGKPGHPNSPETRAKLSAANKGRTVSPETRAKQSAKKKGGRFVPAALADQVDGILEGKRTRATRPKPTKSPEPSLSTIRLGNLGQPVYIDGKALAPLTRCQHILISALLDAGPQGMGSSDLALLGFGGWRETLSKLRGSDPAWSRILVPADRPYGRYRLDASREG